MRILRNPQCGSGHQHPPSRHAEQPHRAAQIQHLHRSINHYRRKHQQQPTWAQALTGVDAKLLIPLTVVPPGWPLPPAAWRRDLRTRLMNHLKHTGWITYSTKTRSLQVGSRGHAWLTVTGQPHPASPHTEQAPAATKPRR